MSEERRLQVEVVGNMVHLGLPCGHTLEMTAEQSRGVSEVLDEAAEIADKPEAVQ